MNSKSEIDRLMALAVDKLEDGPERQALLAKGDLSDLPSELLGDDEEEDEKPVMIKDMSIPQKIKLAMFGNKAARGALLREPNRMIQLFVLDNPRITDGELTDIAKNSQVDEQVLRTLASNSQWMKSYSMKLTVCLNPKVPLDISLKWFKFLTDKDLQNIARSKMVPSVLATQARKLLEKKQKKAGGGE